MSWAPLVAFALPLVVAVVLWLWRPTAGQARAVALACGLAQLAVAARQVVAAAGGSIATHAFGNWPPPFGIVFVVDRLAALMVLLQALLLVTTVVAMRPRVHGELVVSRAMPPLLLLSAALTGAFMTGDLFNLFVMFELTLLSSYLLLQVPGGRRARQAAFSNVVINVLASLLFFAAVGMLYRLCGSVNMADVAVRLADTPPELRVVVLGMLVVAFATKAGLPALGFWLPGVYPAVSAPLASFFAGIMTKLGAYALLRTVSLFMGDTGLPPVLVWVGAAGSIVAVLAALAQYELRRLLAFHSISQMGYIVASFALLTPAGVAAAIYFLVHHSLVKSALYLVADELERRHGSLDLRAMKPDSGRGVLAVLFFAAAITLAGLPPTSGFVGKLAVFLAAMSSAAYLPLLALVMTSLFTLASMVKIWEYAFMPSTAIRAPDAPVGSSTTASFEGWSARGPLMVLVLAMVFLLVGAESVLTYAEATAAGLLSPTAYIDAVQSVTGYPVRLAGAP